MFRSLLTLSTTTAVLLHAVLGCCAHHGHADDACPHGVATVVDSDEVSHDHDHCRHERDATEKSQEHHDDRSQPGDREPCDEADCSFVTIKGCDDVATVLLTAWLPMAEDPGSLTTRLESACGHSGTDCPPGQRSLREPLRADTQVWLL